MTYLDELENAYVERLQPLAGDGYGYEVIALPDTQKELEKPATHARITVAYSATRYGDKTSPGRPEILALGIPVQEAFESFSITVEADRRRGRGGCFEALQFARVLLLGWEPRPDFGRTAMMTTELVGYKDGYYSYELIIQTTRMVVPAITLDQQMGGLTADTFPPPTANVVEAPTTTTPN